MVYSLGVVPNMILAFGTVTILSCKNSFAQKTFIAGLTSGSVKG